MLLRPLIIRRLKHAPGPLSLDDYALGGALCDLALVIGNPEVDEGLGLKEAVMRYMSKRERGAAVALAALRQCPLKGFVRSTVVAAFALYLFIGLRNHELIEVAADALGLGEDGLGGYASRIVVEAKLEPALRPTMFETYLDSYDTYRRGLPLPEWLDKRVEWHLGFLEGACINNRPLVYWCKGPRGVKLYTLSFDDVRDLYKLYKDSKYLWEREIAEDLARRYRLTGEISSTPDEERGWSTYVYSAGTVDVSFPIDLRSRSMIDISSILDWLIINKSGTKCRQVLDEIAKQDSLITYSKLAERLGLSKGQVAWLVGKLRAKGLVEAKKGSPGVRLTELGRVVVKCLH